MIANLLVRLSRVRHVPTVRRLPNRTLVLLLSTAALVGGGYALSRELGAIQGQKLTDRTVIAAAAEGTLRPGLSIGSQQQYMRECRQAMMSLEGRLGPTSIRSSILQNCRAGAEGLAKVSPDFSEAWLTAAVAAAGQKDIEAATRYMRQCYRTGRNEQWIAEIRVDLVERDLETVPVDIAADHAFDLRLLLSNDRGRRFLAGRYVTNPELRARIDTELTSLAEQDRRRFTNIASRLATERQRNHGG